MPSDVEAMEDDELKVALKRKYSFAKEKDKQSSKKIKPLPIAQHEEPPTKDHFPFLSLPTEIQLHILSFVRPYYALPQYSVVSKAFNKLLNTDYFWQGIFNAYFGEEGVPECSCWKKKTMTNTQSLASKFGWNGLEIESQTKAEEMLCFAAREGFPSLIRRVMTLYPATAINKWYTQPEPKPPIAPLFVASHYGNLVCCKMLLSYGAEVDFPSEEDGSTALFPAAFIGCNPVIELLISHGANVNKEKKDQTTPLTVAVRKSHVESVRLLLKYGADANKARDDNITPLYISCWLSDARMTEILLKEGKANPNVLPPANTTTTSPLYVAAFGNKLQIAKILLDNGAIVDIRQVDGSTASYIAAFNGFPEMLELLHAFKANFNIQRNDGMFPLAAAAQNSKSEAIKTLLRFGVNVNQVRADGATAAFIAARKGNADALQILIENSNPNLNIARFDGVTALNIASQNGHVRVVELLIKNGAKINMAEQLGVSPLIISSQQGHYEIVRMLLEGHGDERANPHQTTNDDTSALFLAAQQGHYEIVELLIKYKVDVNKKRNNGEAPLHAAVFKGHFKIVDILLKNGANSCIKRNDGVTPLMLAIHSNCMEIAKLLLRHKADVNASRPSDGATALLYSYEISFGRKHMVPLLLAYGADIGLKKKNGKSLESIAPPEQLQEYMKQANEIKEHIIQTHGSLYEPTE
eukprot:TRINITY_DN956_c0_g1_i2.p1 TRINITY_DN956_c0_g1~~TRINITY_DN956_c0_g1_i2.p1  ORF type:complete len:696 (+),score=113.94 TRINITY_DN956_c0_g1_i2:280-2367(+)